MRVVDLPGTVVVVPGADFAAQHRKQREHAGVPRDLDELVAELTARESVSVVFDPPREPGGDHSLLVHGATCKLRLWRHRDRRDCYTIAAVLPLRLGDHHRLARGCLLVRRARWVVAPEPADVPPGSANHWDTLWAAWTRLTGGRVTTGAATLTGAQEAFLATVAGAVDAEERLATATARAVTSHEYRAVTPADGTRNGYDFHLATPPGPPKGATVRVGGDLGHVTAAGERVTVRFPHPVDPAPRGHLDQTPGPVVRREQRQALDLLRERRARNPGLLAALADDTVPWGRLVPPSGAVPAVPLDDDQLAAFRTALAADDLVLVLGPPGTGKTRLARQVAVAAGGRVLLTAPTDRALDALLTGLPPEPLVVMVGDGSADDRPHLLEHRAAQLRDTVLTGVRAALDAYGRAEHAASWVAELDRAVEAVVTGEGYRQRALAALAEARRRAGGPAQALVDSWTGEHDRRLAGVRAADARATRLAARRERAEGRSGAAVLGGYFQGRARHVDQSLAGAEAERARSRAAAAESGHALAAACGELDARTRDAPAVRAAMASVDAVGRDLAVATAAADTAASVCRTALAAVATPPPAGEPWLDDVRGLSAWVHGVLPTLRTRARLLTEWYAEVSGDARRLHPELVRYADVLAATCAGVATSPDLSDVDLDLVVVDDAGALGLPEALVPLVRAGRAVLLGDHHHPPPCHDAELAATGVADGDPAARALLTTNVLALLAPRLADDHVATLTHQHRMPATVADFLATTRDDGRPRTEVVRTHQDDVFTAQFVFVDTSALPTRAERPASGPADAGYVNTAEADLLVELAAHHHRRHADWTVIVPYEAQADLLRRRLAPVVGGTRTPVSTAGTCQGAEHDVVLYGFTRSNPDGATGALDDPRRAVQALSRAKERLVLVGDLTTLTTATDPDVRRFGRALRTHLADRGDVRGAREVMARLREVRR